MEVERFVYLVKKAKKSQCLTGYRKDKVGLKVNHDRNDMILYCGDICKTCSKLSFKAVRIKFDRYTKLSIFQADLIFMLFAENKIPKDYADYHKCKAGKEFIESIVSYEVI